MPDAIEIRALRSLGEMRAAVKLQRVFWGDELESVVPAHMLYSLAQHGGHVLAAFEGRRMVGVLIGFLGTGLDEPYCPAPSNIQIVSKRMVVLPELRSQGIGYRLKLAQRELAVQQRIPLITWTFDPLQTPNATLNIHKLGGVSRRYLENFYGVEPDGNLTLLGSSDRLLVEWWVERDEVVKRLMPPAVLSDSRIDEVDIPVVNPAQVKGDGSLALPGEWDDNPTTTFIRIEVPDQYNKLVDLDAEQATAWRLHTRAVFQQCFRLGYSVVDFVKMAVQGSQRTYYVLRRGEA
jgi:predicted GNAT superfamily acetyltransferase